MNTKLNGTEKQIAWAEEIRERLIRECQERISKISARLNDPSYDPEFDGKRENLLAGIEYLDALTADIQETSSAAWFCDRNSDSVDRFGYPLYDAEFTAATPIHGLMTHRQEIIRKYRGTNIRFSR